MGWTTPSFSKVSLAPEEKLVVLVGDAGVGKTHILSR